MSQRTAPVYQPPQPVYAMTGQSGIQQGYNLASQLFPYQMNAQAQGIQDINQGASYYNNFGPTSLSEAIGNQYMNNIWPQQQAMISNQFANSGMQNSPALANTMANAYGNLATGVGQYEQGISEQNATNNLSDLLSINPNSYYQPMTNDILSQSNVNTELQNQYNQAVAQEQYQQSYNKYAQQNALASTIGQISPIGGQIYGATSGTSLSALGGTAQTLSSPLNALALNQMMSQYNMQPGVQGGNAGMGYGGNSSPTSYSDNASNAYTASGVANVPSAASTLSAFGSY